MGLRPRVSRPRDGKMFPDSPGGPSVVAGCRKWKRGQRGGRERCQRGTDTARLALKWRRKGRVEESGQLQTLTKAKNWTCPWSLQKGRTPSAPLDKGGHSESDLHHCNIINLCCFKPQLLWSFITAAIPGSPVSHSCILPGTGSCLRPRPAPVVTNSLLTGPTPLSWDGLPMCQLCPPRPPNKPPLPS